MNVKNAKNTLQEVEKEVTSEAKETAKEVAETVQTEVAESVSKKVGNIFGEIRKVEGLSEEEIIKMKDIFKAKGIKIKSGDRIYLIINNKKNSELFEGFKGANVCMAIGRGDEMLAYGFMNAKKCTRDMTKAFSKGEPYQLNIRQRIKK